ncbi:hypothetical protein MKZ38_006269 [Zalerion maritima]|uniref:C2H2-type domain-containing protein n=1 Tax=Zalerion maritima TaxID=339359 RepID=A0AAD5WNI7_9PEZI|nr:hypothetical protein MKZ38_006269 [Zalerion maritima]
MFPPFVHQQEGLRNDRHLYDASTIPLLEGQENASSTSLPANIAPASHLSPYSSPHFRTSSASPPTSTTHTPAESVTSLSVQQSVTDYHEQLQFMEFDPFVGADFDQNNLVYNELMSSFGANSTASAVSNINVANASSSNHLNNPNLYPISPDTTPQLGTTSPPAQGCQAAHQGYFKNSANANSTNNTPSVVAPQDLLTKRPSFPLNQQSSYQLTPEASGGGSGHSSDDDMAHSSSGLAVSPRVAVSYWDENNVVQPVEPQADADGPTTPRHINIEMGFAPVEDNDNDEAVVPQSNFTSLGKRQGVRPEDRSTEEVGASMNEMNAKRKIEERNEEVRDWIKNAEVLKPETINQMLPRVETEPNNIRTSDIPLGDRTENQLKEGQTYFDESGGQVNQDDIRTLQENRNWADAPVLPSITKADTGHCQPETSQQAIEKYQRMNDDVGSTISRAATWGTRPRSIGGMSQKEREDVLSGNILKKLSISTRGPAQFLQNMRRPSVSSMLKRSKTDESERSADDKNNLTVPRTSSWKKQNQVPSINTAIIAAGNTGMSITTNTGNAAGHGRSGSVSATSVTSPKSPLVNLGAHIKKGRMRALSDISTKSSTENTNYPHLVNMWRQQGGPPIAALGASTLGPEDVDTKVGSSAVQPPGPVSACPPNAAMDDEDDDEDDEFEDSEMKGDDKLIESIEPNLVGFQKQVLKLNPSLQNRNNFLVDRIAYQQVVRYKNLLNSKVKHLNHVSRRECSTGPRCIALGGTANVLDKGGPRGLDPGMGGSDGDVTPLEGAINQDSFPQDIPMPPTATLPAEFECQLCYASKTFKKPSDWTKHVHEDVQPFTCTWDRCREPKIFKRKADWVRHENEGHRHLEWWTCDVEDCRHTCYRRDNFLQHLVREHKFPEPKVKTKAAIKKEGGKDPTWQKVEKCHHDTTARPQDEPCRFCGKAFPTWKKLTVHLAKHMEQISLPILRLVAAKDLDADTIISPVQEPPPRQFPPVTPSLQDSQFQPSFHGMPVTHPQINISPNYHPGYTTVTPPEYSQQTPYFNGFNSINSQVNQGDMSGSMGLPQPNNSQGISPALSQQSIGQMSTQYPAVQVPITSSSFPNVHEDGFMPSAATTSGLEPFPALTGPALGQGMNAQTIGTQPMSSHPMSSQSFSSQGFNALGLSAPCNNHLGGYEYDTNPELQQQFSSPNSHPSSIQGSVSPYGHSPHQGTGGFYS